MHVCDESHRSEKWCMISLIIGSGFGRQIELRYIEDGGLGKWI